ncbi:pentatricopeptide repeat-containing protein At4g01570 [Telopea speciosissima]|uniref:pentatricopeptide repeat-containing protein At4g01570 n=1 Tax=Telopea speciosissima TaxID=54955 RepID=UPI001CC41076|nr:pentatricopeptide repeat-containing protein At4g01570 [Telopea speciosissima]
MRNGKILSLTLLGTSSELVNILLVASLSKTLSVLGTRNLDGDSIQLSESLVLQILRRNSLDTSKKVDFFRWASLRPGYKHSSNTYSQVFHAICRAGCLDELPPLLRLMKEDGVVVDSATFKLLLDAYIRSGKFDSALDILDDMEELGTSLNPHMYNSVVVALVRKNQVDLALSMFYKLLEALNDDGAIVPNPIACNELLIALRKADKRVEFRKVFEKVREKSGFVMDTRGYNICIHAFGCWGDLGTSLELFKEMKEKALSSGSPSPDLCTYNSLIRVMCLVGKVKDALIVFEELKGSGHEPDAFTYRILIQGCCKSYRVDDATKIFCEMQYNSFRPDTVVYNSLLDGLFKARRLTEACQLFEKMMQDGVRASCWSYNILIDGLFKNGRAAAGYTLFCDLKKKGQLVDGVTYSIVVQHLCKEDQLEGAFDLVSEMEARGYVVDLVTISSLLISLHKHGRADKLLKHIRDGTLVPNVIGWIDNMEASIRDPKTRKKDFTSMFSSKTDVTEILGLTTSSPDDPAGSCVDATDGGGQGVENPYVITDQWSSSPYMDKLANEMKAANQSFLSFSVSRGQRVLESGIGSFDIDMINTYLSIYLAKGNLSLACKLFEIFTEMGVNPVNYSYNSMMSSFVKKGYFNEAWSVLHEMGEKLCPADIATYNVIIQGLGKMGRADLAIAVLDQLMNHGGYLDIVMYNTLIHALGRAGRIDEANNLFEQMKTSGINPDVVTFNTLIEVHSKAGQVKEAYRFLKMMLDAGCSPNHVTDTTLDFLEKEIEKIRYAKASIKRHSNGENGT